MIFGFNTDIKHADVVYHVQSEMRKAECLLQTQVFVRGRCIGKLGTAIAELAADSGESDSEVHERLKAQHRQVLEAIRTGQVDALFPAAPATDAQPALPELRLEALGAETHAASQVAALRFRVLCAGAPVASARVIARLDAPGRQPAFIQVETAEDGKIEITVPLDRAVLPGATIALQATHSAGSIRRRFRLRSKQGNR